jgi:hypothetical protein
MRFAPTAALIEFVVPLNCSISPGPPWAKPSVLMPRSRKKFERRSERS